MSNWTPTPVRPDGEYLTGVKYQADREQAAAADVPQVQDDYSADLTQMQTVADPAPSGTPSLATTLAGELERLRYVLLKIKQSLRGTVAQWYEPFTIDPATLPPGPTGPTGPTGPAGAAGATGPAGPGVPVAGTTGQVLTKTSATDYDTGWQTPAGGGGSLPDPVTVAHGGTGATAVAGARTNLDVFSKGEIQGGVAMDGYLLKNATPLAGNTVAGVAVALMVVNASDQILIGDNAHTIALYAPLVFAQQDVYITRDLTVHRNAQIDGNLTVTGTLTPSAVLPSTCEGRLTTESGVPVSTADRTAQATLYFTPFRGNQVALYSGTAWALATLTERSLALSGLTTAKNYDVFLWNNAGTLTLELSAAWTTDIARADALALQDGVYVKGGAPTRRFVGTIRTTGTTTTEDSLAKRYVWNATHRVRRPMRAALETANSWTYTLATWRQANANAANQLECVLGLAVDEVDVTAVSMASNTSACSAASGIGVDSTSVNSAFTFGGNVVGTTAPIPQIASTYRGIPGIGRHFFAWLEIMQATGTGTFYGDNGLTYFQSGIYGSVWA